MWTPSSPWPASGELCRAGGGPPPSFPGGRRFLPWSRFPSHWGPAHSSKRGTSASSACGSSQTNFPRRLPAFGSRRSPTFISVCSRATCRRRAGVSVLRGEAVTVGNILRIAGVDDPTAAALGEGAGRPENEVLGETASPMYTILLKHRPLLSDGSRGPFDPR